MALTDGHEGLTSRCKYQRRGRRTPRGVSDAGFEDADRSSAPQMFKKPPWAHREAQGGVEKRKKEGG